jgi:Cdc6-like AAA superfamily ATPase
MPPRTRAQAKKRDDVTEVTQVVAPARKQHRTEEPAADTASSSATMAAEAVIAVAQSRLGAATLRGNTFHLDVKHRDLLTQLCANIGGASTLGHRTCHCLWGPPGSGKRRMLQAIASHFSSDARSRREYAVITLETDVLKSDDDALAAIFETLRLYFVRLQRVPANIASAQSNTAFTVHGVLKALTKLFETVLPDVIRLGEADAEMCGLTFGELRWHVSAAVSTKLFTAVGTTALDALQRALIDVNQSGLSLVVIVPDIAKFATRCDRVAYLLSGIMHECQSRAGGVSLICGSDSSDFALEKRLSSRLCCDLWMCPPIRVSFADALLGAFSPENVEGVVADMAQEFGVPVKAVTQRLGRIHTGLQTSKSASHVTCAAMDVRTATLGRSAQQCREILAQALTLVTPSTLELLHEVLLLAERAGDVSPFAQQCGARLAPSARMNSSSLEVALVRDATLPREAVILLTVVVMLQSAASTLSAATRRGMSLSDAYTALTATFPAEKAPHKQALYEMALDVLMERGLCALDSTEAIVLATAESAVRGLLADILCSDAAALRCGVRTEQKNLRALVRL